MDNKSTPKKRQKFSIKLQEIKEYSAMMERIRRNLCYGDVVKEDETIDYPSMPLTEVTVDLFYKASLGNQGLDIFDMNFASDISRKSSLSPCSLVLAIIYLERLKRKNPDYLRSVSPRDLFLVSIMIATKYLFDDGEEEEILNDEWANSSGIDLKEMNRLEREYLNALDWTCYVDQSTFFATFLRLEAIISFHQFTKRGKTTITYNELMTIFNELHFWSPVVSRLLQVLVISTIAYWTTAFAMIASSSLILPSALTVARQSEAFFYPTLPDNRFKTINNDSSVMKMVRSDLGYDYLAKLTRPQQDESDLIIRPKQVDFNWFNLYNTRAQINKLFCLTNSLHFPTVAR